MDDHIQLILIRVCKEAIMIIEKDRFQFYADNNGSPDVLLYAPTMQGQLFDYIVQNKIKKIALCGGGTPTQDYLDTIRKFTWIEYINGYCKGLDFSFLNNLENLKVYIGTLDFTLENKAIKELYVTWSSKAKISNRCSNLEIINIEKGKSFSSLFSEGIPNKLKSVTLVRNSLTDFLTTTDNFSIEHLELSYCSKLKSLKGIENFNSLKQIRLINCKNLEDISSLVSLKNLQELTIYKCPSIAQDSINELKTNVRLI